MDSGSMPFAQNHYPFASNDNFTKTFPGDFIAEYTGQIRAWFYVLHVLSNALFNSPAYKNVLVSGVLAGNDGRKMSKSFNNYPDPKETLEKYGAEALRMYFFSSAILYGEDANFDEEELKAQTRDYLLPLWNSFK
jgi:isoleucyl-tRNA synthetase